jgi:short-subunit dehydrogenase
VARNRGVPLSGARALVTGASGGIGRAVVEALVAHETAVVATARDRDALDDLARRTGARPVVADLTEPDAPDRVVREAVALLGGLDVVVSSAGIGWAGSIDAMSAADIDQLVAVNLTAPLQLCRAVLPHLRGPGPRGALVLVGSIAGLLGVADEAVYSATKAGLTGLADALRCELHPAGIDVLLVSPGVVDTAFFARRNVPYQRRRPRPIPPERVAHALVAGLRTGQPVVIVPRWLALPVRLRGIAPAVYGTISRRFA